MAPETSFIEPDLRRQAGTLPQQKVLASSARLTDLDNKLRASSTTNLRFRPMRHSAFWASWADSLLIKERHPVVAVRIGSLNGARPAGPCLRSATLAANQLRGVEGLKRHNGRRLQTGSAQVE